MAVKKKKKISNTITQEERCDEIQANRKYQALEKVTRKSDGRIISDTISNGLAVIAVIMFSVLTVLMLGASIYGIGFCVCEGLSGVEFDYFGAGVLIVIVYAGIVAVFLWAKESEEDNYKYKKRKVEMDFDEE